MEDHQLEQYDGLDLAGTIARLRQQGYRDVSTLPDEPSFAHPLRPHSVLRLSPHCETSHAFIALCRAHPDNPYLPRLGSCRTISAATPYTITTMEALEHVRLRHDATRAPLVGTARALTLLLEGDEDHATVYQFMMQKKELREAVQAITQTICQSLTATCRSCLCYASGMDRTLPLNQQETNHILFRHTDKGPQPVFTAPFRTTTITDESTRLNLQHYTHLLRIRAHLEQPAPHNAHAPVTDNAPVPPHA
jgi:hypothetical protein